MCRKARQHEPLVSNRGVQIDRQQSNNRAESHDTQGILPYPAYVNKTLKVDIAFLGRRDFSLNEETWVQDIKEKREVYGISQQKLALAAGITRPYLSDIETGKAHPSEHYRKPSRKLWNASIQTLLLKCSLTMCGFVFHYGCEAYRGRRAAAKATPTLSMKTTASILTQSITIWVIFSFWYRRNWKKGCCSN